MELSVLTAAMRSEFETAYESVAATAPIEDCMLSLNSTARIENYNWLSPTPAIAEYLGHRRLGSIGEIKYRVVNKEYDSAIQILIRDIEDAQTGGYRVKFRELAAKAKVFPNHLVLELLDDGDATTCFDGTNFFADSHTIGTGDNLMTASGTGTANGLSYKIVALVKTGMIKPLIYQDRKPFKLMDDTGSPDAAFRKEYRWWIDGEGAAAFGYWWDAIQYTFTGIPTLTEVQTALGEIENRFRTFKLPKAFTSDRSEFPHEQLEFNANTVTFVCATGLGNLMRTALNSDQILNSSVAVTNLYKGFGKLVVSAKINDSTLQ